MSFNQDPNAPDFAAIYSTTQPVQTADLTTELAEIGVTSLTGLSDVQLQDIATRLDAHRAQKAAQQAAVAQTTAQTQAAAAQAQQQYLEAQTASLNAQTTALTNPTQGLDPAAWLAYLQKVGPKGYGGDPADYANAIYDAHYQVAQAGGAAAPTPAAAAAPAPAAATPAAAQTATTAQMLAAIAKRSPGANPAQVQHTLSNDLAKGYTPEHILAGQGGGTAPVAQPAPAVAQPVPTVTQPAGAQAAPVAQSAPTASAAAASPITQPAPMSLTEFNAANRAGVISRAGAAKIDYNTTTVNKTVANDYAKYLAGLPK